MAKIRANNNYLLASDVYEREQLAWPDYQYPAAQLTYHNTWLANRLLYLDSVFKPAATLLASAPASTATLQLYPNPASDYLHVNAGALPCELTIREANGKTVLQTTLAGGSSQLAISDLPKGLYVASLKNSATTVVRKLVVQ